MKEQLDRIKTVLATKDFGTHLNHYLFEPGWVLASDGRMVAAVPTGQDLTCLVPGPELEAVTGRLLEALAVSYADEKLQLKSGRLHGAIATLPVDSVQFFRPEHEWLVPPPAFVEALRLARPFIAETAVQPWALCACLHANAIVATNNISIVRVDCAGLDPDRQILLPSWACDFILKHSEPLTGVMWNENYAAFKWESGLWFRTQLVIGQFPPQIAAILAAPERATTPIAKEWLRTYESVAALSENNIRIEPEAIIGGHGKAEVRAEIETPLTAPILFNPKFLSLVLAAADFWAPEIYPAPVPFRGAGFSGVVMGRKA